MHKVDMSKQCLYIDYSEYIIYMIGLRVFKTLICIQ